MGAPTLRAQAPNILTAARLAMTVAFVVLLSLYDFPDRNAFALPAAAALFAAAAATDAIDGILARRWNAISVFGRVMDPLADKLLVLSAFVLLAGPPFHTEEPIGSIVAIDQLTGVYPWMAALILARELLITSLRGVCEARGIDFSASTAGKFKMVAQSIAVPAILLIAMTHPGNTAAASINFAIGLAVTLITAWSAVPYISAAVRGLKQQAPIT